MLNSPGIRNVGSPSIPATRGVYCEQIEPHNETVYYAITSTGQLLNGELRRRASDETETMLVRDLWRDLNRQDPSEPIPPRLALVR